MGIVQLLAILLLPLILAGIAFRAWQSSKIGPTGFGGWLLVLAIGQTGAPSQGCRHCLKIWRAGKLSEKFQMGSS